MACEFTLPDTGCIDEGSVLGAFQASSCNSAVGLVLAASLDTAFQVQEWRCAAVVPKEPTRAEILGIDPPSWSDFATHYLLYPLLVQLVLSGLCMLFFKAGYRRLMTKSPAFSWFIHRYVGTGHKGTTKPTSPIFPSTIYLLQIPLSAWGAALFFLRFENQAKHQNSSMETVITVYFIFNYTFLRIRDGFGVRSSWGVGSLIDVLTITPVVLNWIGVSDELEMTIHGKTWLSLDYFRAWRCLQAIRNIERQVGMGRFSELQTNILFSLFKMMAMVICMGGTICVLEVLGEVPAFPDKTLGQSIALDNGADWSGLVMIYYVFITISTVGYGDYSPTTFPSRLFSCLFIVIGIYFFNAELERISALRTALSTGKGKYLAREGEDGQHIVIMGTGVGKSSSTMEAFLSELLDRQNEKYVAPDVVLLSEEPFDTALRDFVATMLPEDSISKVFLLVGSAMNPKDLERVALQTTKMAFVVPDIMAPDSEREDGQNLVRAIQMRNFAPGLRLRLMLLKPESRTRAVNVGIKAERCFSAHEMKANFMVQAARVRGFLPLVGGLVQVTPQHEIKQALDLAEPGDVQWMKQYLWGLQWTVYGLVIHKDFEQKPFSEVTANIYEKSGGEVLLIAALDKKGRLQLNYPGNLTRGQVVMAMACSSLRLTEFEDAESDWRKALTDKRMEKGAMTTVFSPTPASLRRAKTKRVTVESRRRRIVEESYELRSLSRAGRRGLLGETRARAVSGFTTLSPTVLMSPAEILQSPRTVALVVAGAPLWCEIQAFLAGLRRPHLPRPPPICVLCADKPPMEVAAKFQGKDVVFLSGSVMNIANLVRAGLHRAHVIVVFRGASPSAAAAEALLGDGIARSHVLADDASILLASTIEQIVEGNCQSSPEGLPRQAVYEFASSQSVHLVERAAKDLLSQFSGGGMGGTRSFVKGAFNKQKAGSNVISGVSARQSGVRVFKKVAQYIGLFFSQVAVKLFAADEEGAFAMEQARDQFVMGRLVFHKHFAAGQIFTSDFYGKALGHIFVFPATIELSEALSAPDRTNQTSFMWQVKCPHNWVGKRYADLVVAWLRGGWVNNARGPPLSEEEPVGCAVVLGLYRGNLRIRGGGFNMTMPGQDETLHPTDLITVLADSGFGRRMTVSPDAGS